MEVTRENIGDSLNLIVKGRLDGYWADHLAKELADVLREGVHQVCLDLAGVSFMSSAGIGTLVNSYKEFKAIHGSFTVIKTSPQVRTLLSLTKLDTLLIADTAPPAPASTGGSFFCQVQHNGVTFEVY